MTARTRHPHLPVLALLLAAGHATIVVLALAGRTAPYLDGGRHHLEGALAVLDAAPVWVPLHAIACLLLAGAAADAIPRRLGDQAAHISAGIYGAWGVITFAWAATRHPPVSLLGPALTLIFAGVAVWVGAVWDDDLED